MGELNEKINGTEANAKQSGIEPVKTIAATRMFEACGCTGVGGRSENQDTYDGMLAGENLILTVCDGMGGMNGGQTASKIAATEIVQTLADTPADKMGPDAIRNALMTANAAVYRRAFNEPALRGMGTTATVLVLTPKAAYVTHIGDSRVYQFRNGKKIFRTFDHSKVFEMVEKKVLTEEQARQSSFSNIITRALGIRTKVEMTVETLPYKKGDRFVLCCDGIWNAEPEPVIIKLLTVDSGNPEKAVQHIAENINEIGLKKGGQHDNLTAIIVDVKQNSQYQESWMSKVKKIFRKKPVKVTLIAFMMALASSGHVFAQATDWLVLPRYNAVEFYAPGLYKVTENGKIGLVSTAGKEVVPISYNYFGDFYDGRAVFGIRTKKGVTVKGVVTDNGEVYFVNGEYTLLPDYMFYSEGYLPVRDENGRYGFLNNKCEPAFDFISDVIHPFSEGFAAVGEGDTFHWINTDGEKIVPRLSNGGTPYGGTNFADGKAYLWDEDGVMFVLGSDGRTKKIGDRDLYVDYLYRVDTGKGDNPEYTTYQPEYENKFIPKESDGKWSYVSETGKLLGPFQYEAAERFSDGVAIAEANGKYGLLEVVPDNSTFDTRVTKRSFVFSPGSTLVCGFELLVPEKWKDTDLKVTLTDANTGNDVHISHNGKNYTFNFKPNASVATQKKSFNVSVSDNGINLWQGAENYIFNQRANLTAKIRINNATANSNDRCLVIAAIHNPSPIDITTTVTMSGGGTNATFSNFSKTITVPAHSTKTVTGSFYLKKNVLNAWCKVSTTDGGHAQLSNFELGVFN